MTEDTPDGILADGLAADRDVLAQAAERASVVLPGDAGKYVAMLLEWHRQTRNRPSEQFSVASQVSDKLARVILALPVLISTPREEKPGKADRLARLRHLAEPECGATAGDRCILTDCDCIPPAVRLLRDGIARSQADAERCIRRRDPDL